MAINLTVNNQTFSYPSPGDDQGWGADATDWAEAVTTIVNTLSSPGDIPSTLTIMNNHESAGSNPVADFQVLPSLSFNSLVSKGAEIKYLVERVLRDGTISRELGTLLAVQITSTNWVFSQFTTQTADVSFAIVYDSNFAQFKIKTGVSVGVSQPVLRVRYSAKSFNI